MIDERKNAEGYSDYTAYNGIRNVMQNVEIKKGDVYGIRSNDKAGLVLVVSDDKANRIFEYVQTVMLVGTVTDELSEYHAEVYADKPKTALCNTLKKVFKVNLLDHVATVSESDVEKVDVALREYLGIGAQQKATAQNPADGSDKFKAYIERVKLTTERDMFKQLYEETLRKLMER